MTARNIASYPYKKREKKVAPKKAVAKRRNKKLEPEEILLNKLEGLGRSSEEIFTFMVSQGIRGRKKAACDCPVTRFLKKEGYDMPFVGLWTLDASTKNLTVGTPAPVREFIRDFDKGKYPSLVDKS